MKYAELQVTTNYSFLRGGSHPKELVEQAIHLGHDAIGIADRNTLAGIVRAYVAVRDFYEETAIPREDWIKLIVGARLETTDGYSLLAYPMNLDGYKRLSRLLSEGNREAAKGACELTFGQLEKHAEDILAIALPPRKIDDPAFHERLRNLARLFKGRCYLAGTMLFRGNDAERLADLDNLATQTGTKLVATNDVHYLEKGHSTAHDCLVCIGRQVNLSDPKPRYVPGQFYLRSAEEMKALFAEVPDAVTNTMEVAEKCNVEFDLKSLHYPVFHPPETFTREGYLRKLLAEGLGRRYTLDVKAVGKEFVVEGVREPWRLPGLTKEECLVISDQSNALAAEAPTNYSALITSPPIAAAISQSSAYTVMRNWPEPELAS